MRLIDADKLIDVIESRINDYGRDCNVGAQKIADLYQYEIKKMVDKQPTAYDIDNVVKQLEGKVKELENISANMVLNKYQKRQNYGYCVGIEHAIEIVKGGGADA